MNNKSYNSAVYAYKDGTFVAVTGIQDGTERSGKLKSLDEALEWCKGCEKSMNGNDVKKKNITILDEVAVVEAKWVKREK